MYINAWIQKFFLGGPMDNLDCWGKGGGVVHELFLVILLCEFNKFEFSGGKEKDHIFLSVPFKHLSSHFPYIFFIYTLAPMVKELFDKMKLGLSMKRYCIKKKKKEKTKYIF